MAEQTIAAPGSFIVDADSHWTEHPDLFTRRAPAKYKDRVPRVEDVDGVPSWVFDGHVMGRFYASAVVARDGAKSESARVLEEWRIDDIHVGAYDPKVRLEVLDQFGIDAQLIFPSSIGLGGQDLAFADDDALRQVTIELYNDIQAQTQAESKDRLLPMPLMPAWSVDACVAEAKRVAALGARGINMTSDPQDLGAPDLASEAWDPFWAACTEYQLPVHFHIGASVTGMGFFGKYPWPSHSRDIQLAIGGTLLFIGNARVVVNLILSHVFDRFPDLQVVSVESGCGWIPFILEALDYEISENAPYELRKMKRKPSEYFKTNLFATFWFENNFGKLADLVETVGEERILFATDFPHPTCLYPNPLQTMEKRLSVLPAEARTKILGGNARQLYRL
ncbi:MAG: amidohydrolase [Acidimicrobiaceae bacterium]|nr:amidohydrolase [Acidimicrobiaceae bacterium]